MCVPCSGEGCQVMEVCVFDRIVCVDGGVRDAAAAAAAAAAVDAAAAGRVQRYVDGGIELKCLHFVTGHTA